MLVRATKKPVTVEAVRFTYESGDFIKEWASDKEAQTCAFNWGYENYEVIDGNIEWSPGANELWGQVYDVLHETWINVYPGQWVIKGVQGEFYPCDNDVMHATYELEQVND